MQLKHHIAIHTLPRSGIGEWMEKKVKVQELMSWHEDSLIGNGKKNSNINN